MTSFEIKIKRGIDLTAGSLGLLALAPLLSTIALAIRLDSRGPALFRQKRLGLNGMQFEIFKFRTMHHSAAVAIDDSGNVVNRANDARHTRVGRLLRRYSLDEFPQLINVVHGEMSLVGPRPDLPEALNFYTHQQQDRLLVKPGITGLAQVRGRNALSPSQKWALDAEYARTSSLKLDAWILAKTLRGVVSPSGIYKGDPP